MSSAPPPVLGHDHAALMRRRVSIIVGSRDAQLTPHLMRAVGSRLSADRRELTIFLSASGGRDVVADLRANGRLAVVFSEPSTHRSLQIKGEGARVEPLQEADRALVDHYVACFADEIGELGYDRAIVQTMFAHDVRDLVAIRFEPAEVYEQTPGPDAGKAVAGVAR